MIQAQRQGGNPLKGSDTVFQFKEVSMSRFSIKPGDRLTVDEDTVLQIDRICGNCAYLTAVDPDSFVVERDEEQNSAVDIRAELKGWAEEILFLLSDTDAVSSQEMLADFISDLFYAVAQKRQKEERRQKQAEGIAKAKAKGIRFGPATKPVPDGFESMAQMWTQGDISSRDAAKSLGMSHSTFLRWAKERESSGSLLKFG